MIRRGFWLAVGAAGGVWGYRRVSALGRDVSARLDGSPNARKVRRGVIRSAIRFGRDTSRFTRDVREGMDLYIARQEGADSNTLGPSENTDVKEDR
jgi:hypothetical protein